MEKKYKIFASLMNEAIEGWIWTNNEAILTNEFIIICNSSSKKKSYVLKEQLIVIIKGNMRMI